MNESLGEGMEGLVGVMTLSYSEPFGHPVHTVMITFSAAMTLPKVQIITVDNKVHDLPLNPEVEATFQRNFISYSEMMRGLSDMIRNGNQAAHLAMRGGYS